MHCLVLARGGEQQAPIWGECETSEERCQGLVEVDGCVADAQRADTANARRVGHDCGQGHRWSW
jgi:hypothetical protein